MLYEGIKVVIFSKECNFISSSNIPVLDLYSTIITGVLSRLEDYDIPYVLRGSNELTVRGHGLVYAFCQEFRESNPYNRNYSCTLFLNLGGLSRVPFGSCCFRADESKELSVVGHFTEIFDIAEQCGIV